MIPLPQLIGISAASAILSGAVGYGYGYSKAADKYAALQVKTERANAQAIIKASEENEALKIRLGEDYEKAKLVIADLVRKSEHRVRLPRAQCAAGKPDTAEGSIESDTTAGDIYQRVEEILEADRSRTLRIIEIVEIELAACGVVKDWASLLAKQISASPFLQSITTQRRFASSPIGNVPANF